MKITKFNVGEIIIIPGANINVDTNVKELQKNSKCGIISGISDNTKIIEIHWIDTKNTTVYTSENLITQIVKGNIKHIGKEGL